jgi:hypothetical protein
VGGRGCRMRINTRPAEHQPPSRGAYLRGTAQYGIIYVRPATARPRPPGRHENHAPPATPRHTTLHQTLRPGTPFTPHATPCHPTATPTCRRRTRRGTARGDRQRRREGTITRPPGADSFIEVRGVSNLIPRQSAIIAVLCRGGARRSRVPRPRRVASYEQGGMESEGYNAIARVARGCTHLLH